MRNNHLLTTLSSAIAIAFVLTANQAAAEITLPLSGTVKLGTTDCGNYTQATFDKSGNLTLTGPDLKCLSGAGGGGGNDDKDDKDDKDDNVVDAACGAIPEGSVTNYNHDWKKSIVPDVNKPLSLKGESVYSLRINNADGLQGYGSVATHATARNSAQRTLIISECPGSLTPASSNVSLGTKDSCVSTGTEPSLNWTYHKSVPSGKVSQCRLDPNKDYYVNIVHSDKEGGATCKGSECYFVFDYSVREILQK